MTAKQPETAQMGKAKGQVSKLLAVFCFLILAFMLVQAPPVKLARLLAEEVATPEYQSPQTEFKAPQYQDAAKAVAVAPVVVADLNEPKATRKPPARKIIDTAKLLQIKSGDFERRGYVYAKREVEIKSQLPGLLIAFSAEEGQIVQKGQVLARLDSGVQDNLVIAAKLKASEKAELARVTLVAEQAKVNWERLKKIHSSVAAAKEEVEEAHLKYKEAISQIERVKEQQAQAAAQLKLEETKLSQYTIRAPFTGQIREITSAAGATITPNDIILKLIDINHLRAVINLPGSMFYDFTPGDKHTLKAGEPVNQEIMARVSHIDPAIEPASGTFRCYFDIENPDAKLPYGFMVELLK